MRRLRNVKIVATLGPASSDYDTIQKSLFEGKPVAPSTGVGKAIGQIAEKLVGRKSDGKDKKAAGKNGSALSSLFSLFGR